MNTFKKIVILTIAMLFMMAIFYRLCKIAKAWAEQPSQKEIRANYERVGY